MTATLLCAALVVVGSLTVGQAVLRLCGASSFSWLSAPVGLSALMVLGSIAVHVPGRANTTALLLGLVIVASVVLQVREPAQRPPLLGLAAALPVLGLALVPFVAAGHGGILGVSFNNDTAAHLLLAETYGDAAVQRFSELKPVGYPLGPHALMTTVAHVFGVRTDHALTGLTLAVPLLLGWTALGALQHPRRWAAPFVCLVAGMPYLVAAYYGQGAFKELVQALFVLGAAVALAVPPALRARARWVPFAMVLAGTVSVYSTVGMAWPLAFAAVWLAFEALAVLRAGGGLRALLTAARDGLGAVLIGVGVLVAVLLPQLDRILDFVGSDAATIEDSDLGNLVGPLPFGQALGIWDNPDFRFSALNDKAMRLWAAFVGVLLLVALVRAVGRRRLMVPACAATAAAIWAVSDASQSPYVAGKALIIASPLLLLMAAQALAEGDGAIDRRLGRLRLIAPIAAIVLAVGVTDASTSALRFAKVGGTSHADQLRALRSTLDARPTLFLGNDDFLRWELAGVPVEAPFIGFQVLPIRSGKPADALGPFDVDSLEASTLNRFTWVIAPRDATASSVPRQLRPIRRTRDFVLYRRTGTIAEREILPTEGGNGAAPLDCSTPEGLRLSRRTGIAGVRAPAVGVEAPPVPPGGQITVTLQLTAGLWDLVAPYSGPRPLEVRSPGGFARRLEPNLDRGATRFPIGRLRVRRAGPVGVTFTAMDTPLTAASDVTTVGAVIAVPVAPETRLPLPEACGKLVDWYSFRE